MLKWSKDLYIRDVDKMAEIRRRLEQGKLVRGVYLLTLSETPGNLMEILPASVLVQPAAREVCPEIIGAAGSKETAVSMAQEILMETWHATGEFHVEEYLKNR
ncbi:MAG: hypothetical protein LUF78_11780 [Clostridiales bacterium]|nr:hypothetical protein [Clostridiales bacterium]